MNPKVKKLWIKALLSGKYKQGKKQLYNPDTNRYCCLGVLCDLYQKRVGGEWNGGYFVAGSDSDFELLPRDVAMWAGVSPCGRLPIKPGKFGSSLLGANDGGKRFPAIAKLIDKYL